MGVHQHHRNGDADAAYWRDVAASWRPSAATSFLRAYSDAVNRRLLARWLPPRVDRVLKTDAFDEAVGAGLVPLLAARATTVVTVDVAADIVAAAHARYPALVATVADVRDLPFPDDAFDAILSNSTLDHFESRDELRAGIRELARVLRPGGVLVITLDNPVHPLVALRNRLPYGLLRRFWIAPYAYGVTAGPRRLRVLLRDAGLEVEELAFVMHFPRIVARLIGAIGGRRLLGLLMSFEMLGRLPTRALTGQFVAARAVRR